MTESRYCSAPECERLVASLTGTAGSEDYCALHLKRQQRGSPLTAPIAETMTVEERLFAAALVYEDACAGEDRTLWIDARRFLALAGRRWGLSIGWMVQAPIPGDSAAREAFFSAARAYADADSESDALYDLSRFAFITRTKEWLASEGWAQQASAEVAA